MLQTQTIYASRIDQNNLTLSLVKAYFAVYKSNKTPTKSARKILNQAWQLS